MLSVLLLKLYGWHDFRYSRLTRHWYGFPPHLDSFTSLDVQVTGLLNILHNIFVERIATK